MSIIRKHAPELPIYLLSVPEISDLLDLCLKYNVELMIKPLEKEEVIARIISAIKCSNGR